MSTTDLVNHLPFIATFGLAFSAFNYKRYALPRGWPIGRYFRAHDDQVVMNAGFILLGLLLFSFISMHWWSPFVVLLSGFFLSFAMTAVLRHWVQPVSLIATPLALSWLVWQLYLR